MDDKQREAIKQLTDSKAILDRWYKELENFMIGDKIPIESGADALMSDFFLQQIPMQDRLTNQTLITFWFMRQMSAELASINDKFLSFLTLVQKQA